MPLFLIYELGVFTISASDLPLLRNGADVLMRQIMEVFGIYGAYGFSGTFLFGFIQYPVVVELLLSLISSILKFF